MIFAHSGASVVSRCFHIFWRMVGWYVWSKIVHWILLKFPVLGFGMVYARSRCRSNSELNTCLIWPLFAKDAPFFGFLPGRSVPESWNAMGNCFIMAVLHSSTSTWRYWNLLTVRLRCSLSIPQTLFSCAEYSLEKIIGCNTQRMEKACHVIPNLSMDAWFGAFLSSDFSKTMYVEHTSLNVISWILISETIVSSVKYMW